MMTKTVIRHIGLTLLMLTPSALPAYAQPKAPAYLESILFDEQDVKLSFPVFVHADIETDEVYIGQAGSLVIYNSGFFPLYTFGKRHGISGVSSIATDSRGNTYVSTGGIAEQPVPKIAVYNPAFRLEREIFFYPTEEGRQYSPSRIAIDSSDTLYLLSRYDTKVLVCDLFGRQLDTLSVLEGDAPAPLVDIQIDGKGRIYLVNERDSQIYVLDPKRNYLFKFGEKGGSSGKLSRPISVAIDAGLGLIYINDYMRHAINVYTYSGVYFSELGGFGNWPGWFQYPSRVSLDSKGRLFVADTYNHRVQVFQWVERPDVKASEGNGQGR